MIKGQDKLLEKINKCTLDTFPHSLILLGEEGSGKNLLCDYIANRFNLTLVDITDNLTFDYLQNLYERAEPYFYKIDSSNISIKEQNIILKFLEEPLKNSFIVICCDNESQLISTVINRCQTWKLEKYSKDTLKEFTSDKLVLQIANTPGKVLKLTNYNLTDMFDLANKIFDKISVAGIANTLTLSDKLNYGKDDDKYDFALFVDVLMYIIVNKYLSSSDFKLLKYYELTNALYNNQFILNINKKHLFENYLLKLKEI